MYFYHSKDTTMAKIRDVAREAGVSVATVSRVLTQQPTVSDLTRKHILKVIEELGYRPDEVARSLRRRRTNLIGLIVSTIETPFFTEVARAAEHATHNAGYNLILCNTEEDPQQEERYLQLLYQQQAAGIILAPAPGLAPHLKLLQQSQVPVVLVNRRIDGLDLSSITADDCNATIEAICHLIGQGYEKIAVILGLLDTYTTRERVRGYHQALLSAGIPLNPDYEVSGNSIHEEAYIATHKLMNLPEPPDAIFAFNDLMVQGVIIALQNLGLRWPDDVEVSGFGAFTPARFIRPPLTLIRQPTYEMGCKAVEVLLRHIEAPTDGSIEHVVLKNELIRKEEMLSSLQYKVVQADLFS
jgi:DNA-binding LacI/PurR family transcriptional regulator